MSFSDLTCFIAAKLNTSSYGPFSKINWSLILEPKSKGEVKV